MALSPIPDFISCTGHLEKYWFNELCRLSNYYQKKKKKSTFVNITTHLITNIFKDCEAAKLTAKDTRFLKF